MHTLFRGVLLLILPLEYVHLRLTESSPLSCFFLRIFFTFLQHVCTGPLLFPVLPLPWAPSYHSSFSLLMWSPSSPLFPYYLNMVSGHLLLLLPSFIAHGVVIPCSEPLSTANLCRGIRTPRSSNVVKTDPDFPDTLSLPPSSHPLLPCVSIFHVSVRSSAVFAGPLPPSAHPVPCSFDQLPGHLQRTVWQLPPFSVAAFTPASTAFDSIFQVLPRSVPTPLPCRRRFNGCCRIPVHFLAHVVQIRFELL